MVTPAHPGRFELLRYAKYQVEGSAYCTVPPTTAFNSRGLTDKQYVSLDIASQVTTYQSPQESWKYVTYACNQIGNITAMNGTSYTYDANGSMTARGSHSLTWDIENRLVSYYDGSTTTSFVYDGEGRRGKKTVGSTTTMYVNKYYEKTGSTVTTSYYLGDRLVAQREGTTLRYIHQDHLTGTALTTASDGSSTGSIRYHPYGSTRSGSVPTDKKFTGQRLDGTGLYYYGARYYDPSIGRFISPDVYVQNFTNPQTLNRYTYALNNPLRYTDPTGWWTFGIGFNLNFGAGAGGSGSVTIVFDGHGGIAIVSSGGGGGYAGVGGSLTVQGQWTNADRVQDLAGVCVQTGGSVGVGIFGGGAEWVAAKNYQGVNFGGGLSAGLAPVEMHSNIEYGKVTTLRDTQPKTSSQSEPQLPSTSAPVTTALPVLAAPFTATLTQLNNSAFSVGASEYQQLINQAFNSVYANLGANQMVGWSSELGYHAVDTSSSEYQSYYYWW